MLSQPRVASFDQSLVISAAALDMWAARSGGNTTQETATHSGNEYITKKEKNQKKQVQDDGFLVIKFIITVSLARNHYENKPFSSFYISQNQLIPWDDLESTAPLPTVGWHLASRCFQPEAATMTRPNEWQWNLGHKWSCYPATPLSKKTT